MKKYVRDLEEALIRTLAPLGLEATRIDGLTGVWLERPPRKIASIGVHISRWVTTHGYALNVDLDPAPFTEWITACGLEDAAFTTIARELGRPVTVDEVRPLRARSAGRGVRPDARGDPGREGTASGPADPRKLAGKMSAAGRRGPHRSDHGDASSLDLTDEPSLPVAERPRRPEWMKVRAPSADSRYFDVKKLIHGSGLHTICEEARCPNIAECWGRGTATFQILGDTCTRACRYCYVHSGKPESPPDPLEPLRLANVAAQMELKHVVVTSVDRDDVARPRRRPLRSDDPRAQGEAARTPRSRC